jgi:hypothetical protein
VLLPALAKSQPAAAHTEENAADLLRRWVNPDILSAKFIGPSTDASAARHDSSFSAGLKITPNFSQRGYGVYAFGTF